MISSKSGVYFWDMNPCGGRWNRYDEYMRYVFNVESYLLDFLYKFDFTDKKILEVGCGQGVLSNYFALRGAFVDATDISQMSLEISKSGSLSLGVDKNVSYRIENAEKLSFAEDSYDIVFCIGVLHHTDKTEKAVKEIYRVLKKDGVAVVMLYRKGNPKWWVTSIFRLISRIADKIKGKEYYIAEKLRSKAKNNQTQGTALLELFGVPILKAYSNKDCRKMFSDFSSVNITNHQPGFERNCDVIKFFRPLRGIFRRIDIFTKSFWGFYQVIEAKK